MLPLSLVAELNMAGSSFTASPIADQSELSIPGFWPITGRGFAGRLQTLYIWDCCQLYGRVCVFLCVPSHGGPSADSRSFQPGFQPRRFWPIGGEIREHLSSLNVVTSESGPWYQLTSVFRNKLKICHTMSWLFVLSFAKRETVNSFRVSLNKTRKWAFCGAWNIIVDDFESRRRRVIVNNHS